MSKYHVSFIVEADSPEEAADIVAQNCEYDVDGNAVVTDIETDEQFEL